MVTKKQSSKEVSKEVWFLFDLRGGYHGHVGIAVNGKGMLMLKQGDYDDFLLNLGRKVGDPEKLKHSYIVKDVDVKATRQLFEDEGFTVQKATTQDFDELKRELDKLETIKGGESEKYKRGSGR